MSIGKIEEALNKKADKLAEKELNEAIRMFTSAIPGPWDNMVELRTKDEKAVTFEGVCRLIRKQFLPKIQEKKRAEEVVRFMTEHRRLRDELVDLGIEVEEE